MDRHAFEAIVGEIAPEVAGRRIARAYSIRGRCLVLEFAPPRPGFLVLVSMRSLPLVFFAKDARGIPAPPERARPGDVERELSGATLVSMEPAKSGLAVVLRSSWAGEAGQIAERALRIELEGGRGAATRPQARTATEEPIGTQAPERPAGAPDRVATLHRWHDAAGRLHVKLSESATKHGAEESRTFPSFNDAAHYAFVEHWAPLDLERRCDALRKVVTRELARKLRAIAKVRAELADAARAEEYRRKGQLILARQDVIKRGAAVATVKDFDDKTLIEIEMNPALGLTKNAEVFFGRARKAARRADRVPKRLAELDGEAKKLAEIERRLASARDSELTALESTFLPPAPEPRSLDDSPDRARFRTYTVSGGWEVLVGKSNRDNDILSHKIARPDDLWFHARQCPGSHVILRRAGKKSEPDKAAILEAAAIAAYHSKAGKSSKVAVCYTEKRHVRKPRGGKPGLAIVAREKVVFVEPKLPEA